MGPDPILAPAAWDIAFVNGLWTPGLAEIEGDGVKLKWDDKKGYGISGASATFTGRDVSAFSLKLTFYEGVNGLSSFEQRLRFFDEIVPVLNDALEGKKSIDFYHAAISEPPYSVTAADVVHLRPLKREHDSGVWSVTIDLKRHSEPKKALGTPKGTSSKNKKPAKDAADLEIEFLTTSLKSLEGV